MAGPKPIPAPGRSERTAVARTWAAECLSTGSDSGSLSVRIRRPEGGAAGPAAHFLTFKSATLADAKDAVRGL